MECHHNVIPQHNSNHVMTQPNNVMTQLGHAVTQASNATTQSSHSLAQPRNATTQPSHAMTQLSNAMTQSSHAMPQSSHAMTQLGHATTQLGLATTQPGHVTTQPGHVTTQPSNATTTCHLPQLIATAPPPPPRPSTAPPPLPRPSTASTQSGHDPSSCCSGILGGCSKSWASLHLPQFLLPGAISLRGQGVRFCCVCPHQVTQHLTAPASPTYVSPGSQGAVGQGPGASCGCQTPTCGAGWFGNNSTAVIPRTGASSHGAGTNPRRRCPPLPPSPVSPVPATPPLPLVSASPPPPPPQALTHIWAPLAGCVPGGLFWDGAGRVRLAAHTPGVLPRKYQPC